MNTGLEVLHVLNQLQGDSSVYIDPEQVAEKLRLSVAAVRGWYTKLEIQGLVTTTGSKGAPLVARITDLGRLALEDRSILEA